MSPSPRRKPILSDGSELFVGLLVGGVVGVWLILADYPAISYIPATIFSFLTCVFGIQFWTEDDRQYWRGIKVRDELVNLLSTVRPSKIKSKTASTNVANGMRDANLILDELLNMKPTKMYGGMFEIAPHVRRLAPLFAEYIDIQEHPSKAGNKYDQIMQTAEEGFQGFAEQMARMLERVNSSDVFNMTTSAEMLRSLRNLLSGTTSKK